jgi:hypothetical protein
MALRGPLQLGTTARSLLGADLPLVADGVTIEHLLVQAPLAAYLSAHGLRTNVLHLPVVGTGDGGPYTTAADFSVFWSAFFAGRIASPGRVGLMVHPHSDWPEESKRYGLGFHLDATNDAVWLEGTDAGVSFASQHQPSSSITYTVISNVSAGVWRIVKLLDQRLGT